MFKCLLSLDTNFTIDNRIVPWDELLSSDTLLNELAHALSRCGWPSRTFEEIRKELLRLHGRYLKCGRYLKLGAKHTYLWSADSEDEDDIFMLLVKSSASSKGKSSASSKGKSSSSSKGKSSASMEDDDDDFM